jgi:hypothetical protein
MLAQIDGVTVPVWRHAVESGLHPAGDIHIS